MHAGPVQWQDRLMWLNQQTLDAIRIMAALARSRPGQLRAAELAERTGITLTNIQKTAHALGQAGMVTATRGRSGGLRLDTDPAAISIGDIVRIFEPEDCPVAFFSPDGGDDPVQALMFRAHRGFFQPLETTTLAMMITR